MKKERLPAIEQPHSGEAFLIEKAVDVVHPDLLSNLSNSRDNLPKGIMVDPRRHRVGILYAPYRLGEKGYVQSYTVAYPDGEVGIIAARVIVAPDCQGARITYEYTSYTSPNLSDYKAKVSFIDPEANRGIEEGGVPMFIPLKSALGTTGVGKVPDWSEIDTLLVGNTETIATCFSNSVEAANKALGI